MPLTAEHSTMPPTHAAYLSEDRVEIASQEKILSEARDEELAQLAARIATSISSHKRRENILGASASLYLVLMLTLLSAAKSWDNQIAIIILFAVFVVGGILILGGLAWVGNPMNRARAAAMSLAKWSDVKAVAPIIDALKLYGSEDQELWIELWKALGRLLPQMTEEEVWALGSKRHSRLVTWMLTWDVRKFTNEKNSALDNQILTKMSHQSLIGILHVMKSLGPCRVQISSDQVDVKILSLLEQWAVGSGIGHYPKVQKAAKECRDSILQKRGAQELSEQLLRASNPTPAGSDVLLRPAHSAEQTDPQELLRPDLPE